MNIQVQSQNIQVQSVMFTKYNRTFMFTDKYNCMFIQVQPVNIQVQSVNIQVQSVHTSVNIQVQS